jgi:hypothetical protein
MIDLPTIFCHSASLSFFFLFSSAHINKMRLLLMDVGRYPEVADALASVLLDHSVSQAAIIHVRTLIILKFFTHRC